MLVEKEEILLVFGECDCEFSASLVKLVDHRNVQHEACLELDLVISH